MTGAGEPNPKLQEQLHNLLVGQHSPDDQETERSCLRRPRRVPIPRSDGLLAGFSARETALPGRAEGEKVQYALAHGQTMEIIRLRAVPYRSEVRCATTQIVG